MSFRLIKKSFPLLLLIFGLLFSLFIFFVQLGENPLQDWDEAFYASATKEMVRNGNWFVIYWNGHVWLDKPPLLIWLNSILVYFGGETEFVFRLVSAFASVLIVGIVCFFSYKKWGILASLFAFSSLILNQLFVWRGRSGNIDSLFTLEILVSFLLINWETKKFRKYFLLGICFGLIYLTKTILVLLPIGIFGLAELLFNRKSIFKNLGHYVTVFGVTSLIIGVWLVGGYLYIGADFIRYYLFTSDQGVLALNQFKLDYWYHTYYSLQRRLFWFLLLGWGLIIWKIRDKTLFLLLLFSVILPFQLSFTKRDNNWYLLPAMPFWSLIIGFAVFRIQKIAKYYSASMYIAVSALLFIFISLISYRTFSQTILTQIKSRSTSDLKIASIYIRSKVGEDELVIRTDDSYPSAIYYSDRHILSTSTSEDKTTETFINSNDLIEWVKSGKVKWLYGGRESIEKILKKFPENTFIVYNVSGNETVLEKRN